MSPTTSMGLPVPDFFDPNQAESWEFAPDPGAVSEAAGRWRREHGLRPAAEDERRTLLLLVDLQKDFCLPEGSLYVGGRSGRGAVEDSQRIARFLYRNLEIVTATSCTLDTHLPHHIFSTSFWVTEEGESPAPHQVIEADDVRRGKLRPRPELAAWICRGDADWLARYALYYCEELERRGRYSLYLWPPHCLVGSPGHSLAGLIQEARLFHSHARSAEARAEIKGTNVLTEHYSILAPEVVVAHDGTAVGEAESGIVGRLLSADRVLVAGQAASHCVKNTVEDLIREIEARDPALLRKVYVLEDCMSAVAVPDPHEAGSFLSDFTDEAEAMLDRCREVGIHVVRSTDPVNEWPAWS